MAFEFWNINSFYYIRYHSVKQQKMHLSSVLSIFCNDSILSEQMNKEKKFQLYDEDSHSIVNIDSYSWGMYKCVILHNFDSTAHVVYFVGKAQDMGRSPAIWICDRDHPISLSGNAEISGKFFAPPKGLSYINLNFDSFRGQIIPSMNIYVSNKDLPAIDSTHIQSMRSLKNLHASISDQIPEHYHSFLNDPIYASLKNTNKNLYAKGRLVVYGDKVRITSSSKISDIILVARYVTIESGFSGSLQIMATDTVLIEKGAYLHYPSGVYIHGDKNKAYLHVGTDSKMEGYAIIEGNVEGMNGFVANIHYRQEKESQLTGLLFVDGIAHVEGTVMGAAYLKECYYLSGENMYSGLIYNAKIVRNDNIAFPFFFEDSGFNRKKVKKIE